MKRIFLSLVSIVLWAQSVSVDDILQSRVKIFTNLDKDMQKEAIITKLYKKEKERDFYELLVVDDDNKILWKSPKVKDIEDDFALGEYDCGVSMPTLVADINQNKKPDILIPLPACDISPTYYKYFELDKNNTHAKVFYLKPLILVKKDKFKWQEPKNDINVTWIGSFERALSKEVALGEIIKITPKKEYRALGVLKFVKDGAKLLDYIIPFYDIQKESYVAKIGKRDHFNSKGVRLRDIRDILIQDRANYFKGVIDKGDEGSEVFKSKKERLRIKNSWIIPVNTTFEDLQDKIIYHNPKIHVVVKNNQIYIELLGHQE